MKNKSYYLNAKVFKIIKLLIILMITSIVLKMLIANSSCTNGAENSFSKKKLYFYSNRKLYGLFKKIGYPDLWGDIYIISRNSDGTALRFLNDRQKKIIVVSCDGSIKIIESPGHVAWLNDANKVVAWHDGKGMIHYAEGSFEKMPFGLYDGPDPSGKYFFKTRSGSTGIYSTDKPHIRLAKVDIHGDRIFYKNGRVYLAGTKFPDYKKGQDYKKWFKKRQPGILIVFKKKQKSLEQIDRIVVDRPKKAAIAFYPADISPWNDEILYLNERDFPSRSMWYIFNLKTHKLRKVGFWAAPFRAFYLQCDIVEAVTKKSKREKGRKNKRASNDHKD